MFVADTNLLLYAANRQAPEHPAAKEFLRQWRMDTESWFVTWSIVYEFLRVATHPRIFERPLTITRAWDFILSLFSSPSFGVLTETDHHSEILGDLAREYPHICGNRAHDLHIAAVMKEHGISTICTADADFHQFRFLRVVNPLLGQRS
ncbi:MAG: PIN domain-containing protein [Acidobacteriia bacterium]|nr:PIN domain-containing protein [Terriglobia bacterium]